MEDECEGKGNANRVVNQCVNQLRTEVRLRQGSVTAYETDAATVSVTG